MPEGKQLKFSFAVDEASAQRVKRILQDLTQEAAKFAKTLQGAGGTGGRGSPFFGGGNVGTPPTTQQTIGQGAARSPLASVAIEGAQAFRGLKDVASDTFRTIDNFITDRIRHLDAFKAKVDEITASMRNLAGAVPGGGPRILDQFGRPAGAAAGIGRILGVGGGPTGSTAAAAAAPGVPPPPPAAGTPGAAVGGGGGGGMGLAALRRFMAPAAGISLIGDVGDEFKAQYFQNVRSEARAAQAFGTMGIATRHGDLSYVAAQQMIRRDNPEFYNIGSLKAAMKAGKIPSSLLGLFTKPAGAFRGMSDIELEAEAKGAMRKFTDLKIQSDPAYFDALASFNSQRESSVDMQRMMGIGEASMHRMLGGGERFGPTGGPLHVQRFGALFSQGEHGAAFMAARAGGREFARQTGKNIVLQQMLGGMQAGAIGQMLQGAAPGGQARAFVGAFNRLDPAAAEIAGGAVSQALQRGGPITPGVALADAVTRFGFGQGSALDTLSARMTAPAMAGLGSMMAGQDPLGRGIRILTADRIMGSGTSIATRDALVRFGSDPGLVAQAMDAKPGSEPLALKTNGITWANIRDFYNQSSAKDINARIPGIFQGNSSTDVAMNKLHNVYGGSIQAFRRGEVGKGGMFKTAQEAAVALGEGFAGAGLGPKEALIAERQIAIQFGFDRFGRRVQVGRKGVVGGQAAATLAQQREQEQTAILNLLTGPTEDRPGTLAGRAKAFEKLQLGLGNISVSSEVAGERLKTFGDAVSSTTVAMQALLKTLDPKTAKKFEEELERQKKIAENTKNLKGAPSKPSSPTDPIIAAEREARRNRDIQ